MRARTIKASIVVLSVIAGTARAEDGVTLASAMEAMEYFASGPNVGEIALPTPEPSTTDRRVTVLAGLDVTNAYFSRGLRQEDRGVIVQPYATVGVDFVRSEEWTAQAYVGTWNSVHDRKTGAGTTDQTRAKWYEADLYFGVEVEHGAWSLGLQYGWFMSPSDAFGTVEELQVTAGFDDEEALGPWALSPTAVLVVETGDGTSDGLAKGGYLQLSVEPGVDIEQEVVSELRLSVPVVLGLSAWDYYEDADGDNRYGSTSIGAKLSCTLHESDAWGKVEAYAAVNLLHLGPLGRDMNDGEETAVVWSCGMACEF